MTYLHAGMIQHDPSGVPTFLHRTAEGKVYPFNNGYRKVSSGRPRQLTLLGTPRQGISTPGSCVPCMAQAPWQCWCIKKSISILRWCRDSCCGRLKQRVPVL